MKYLLEKTRIICAVVVLVAGSAGVQAQISKDQAAKSPWGSDDEIGTLNMMTPESRLAILGQISAGKVYDLSVDLYAELLCRFRGSAV